MPCVESRIMLLQQSSVPGSVQLYIDKYILASFVSLVLGVCLSAVALCPHCIDHAPATSFTFCMAYKWPKL